MTENEAIKEIKRWTEILLRAGSQCTMETAEAQDMAIKALEEVQQYRAIGKISTCQNAVEICKAMIERGIEPDNIVEYIKYEDDMIQRGYDLKRLLEMMEEHKQYRAIGTPEECRAAREKQIPKRPKEYEDKYYGCPTCGNVLLHKWEKYPDKLMDKSNGLLYCLGCGHKLNWEDEG